MSVRDRNTAIQKEQVGQGLGRRKKGSWAGGAVQGHDQQAAQAWALRRQMVVDWQWIAQRLHMGYESCVTTAVAKLSKPIPAHRKVMKNSFWRNDPGTLWRWPVIPFLLFQLLAVYGSLSDSDTHNGQDKHGKRDNPHLFIGGGGDMGSLTEEFLKLAGPEARLVVIPSATADPDLEQKKQLWEKRGFKHVTVLHTNNRKIAATTSFAAPLKEATAVWLGGGVQQRLADLYADTPVEEELISLLDRGGTVGGSSAGAAIQTQAMLCGGNDHPEVRRGLNLFQGAIVDQHFLTRNRIRRLVAAIREHPDLIGYGIDEGTALIVQAGKVRVIGKSYVLRVKTINREIHIDAFRAGDELPLPQSEAR